MNGRLLETKYKESYYLKIQSQSPPYQNVKSPKYSKRSPGRDGEHSPPSFHPITHPSMIVTSAISPSYSEPAVQNHIHVPATIKRESGSTDSAPTPPDSFREIVITDPRHIPSPNNGSEKSSPPPPIKKEKKDPALDKISPQEMEQRNEMFRATYYSHRNGGSNPSNPSNSNPTSRRPSLSSEQRYPPTDVKAKTHHSPHYTEFASYERHRVYDSRSRSPETVVSPYYSRYHEYDHIKVDQEGRNLPPDLKHGPPRSLSGVPPPPPHSHRGEKPLKGLPDPIPYHKSPVTQVLYPNDKNSNPDPIRSKSFHTSHILRQNELKQFPANLPRPLSNIMSTDPDFTKYSSDFYRKLPPKLHIVESQNENGVMLTWNATSNCDSSLVKSYQLFARELFGHKVGTMKRIGVVDALPLPMSCNIDKLKYNIKYKFAVCAVDIYGRFGKMSNFTGKFELKPKGPINEEDDKESEIIVTV